MPSRSLTDKAKSFFKLALENPKAKKMVDSLTWSHIIKFIVDDKPEFYLDVKRGRVKVCPGDSPKKDVESEFYETSRVYTDAETLSKIFEGKKDSVDAQYEDETIKVLSAGKYTQVTFVHQLFKFGREEILERKRREFEER